MVIWAMGLDNSNLYDPQKTLCVESVSGFIYPCLYLLICLYTYMYRFVIILPSAICLCVYLYIYMDISLFVGIHICVCSHNYIQLCLKSISKMQ